MKAIVSPERQRIAKIFKARIEKTIDELWQGYITDLQGGIRRSQLSTAPFVGSSFEFGFLFDAGIGYLSRRSTVEDVLVSLRPKLFEELHVFPEEFRNELVSAGNRSLNMEKHGNSKTDLNRGSLGFSGLAFE